MMDHLDERDFYEATGEEGSSEIGLTLRDGNPYRAFAVRAATDPISAALRFSEFPPASAMSLVRDARRGNADARKKIDTVNAIARSGAPGRPEAMRARENLLKAAALDDIESETGRPYGDDSDDIGADLYSAGCGEECDVNVGSLWGRIRKIGRVIDPTRKDSVFRSAIKMIPIVGESAVSAIDTAKNAADTVKDMLPTGNADVSPLFPASAPVPGVSPMIPGKIKPVTKPGSFALARWYDTGSRANVPGFAG